MWQPPDDREVWLPINEKEFDELVDEVMRAYPQITVRDHAIAVISVAIRHLPNDQAKSTIAYFGHTIIKGLANSIANFKNEKIKHEIRVEQLFNILINESNNMQARDELEKWANDGSIAAKTALKRLEPPTQETFNGATIIPIAPPDPKGAPDDLVC
jgi:hypothetical protein